jgi:tetratricopeptide (TPR) repeat protein/TolB-like protein
MVVTDLSQSPDVEVLPTDRLVQILSDMRHKDDRVISSDTVQEIAKRARVRTVLVGSFVKAGETIRINARLQDVESGRIVTAERVDAANESSLLGTIDDLTRRIRAKFTAAGGPSLTRALLPASSSPADSTITLSLDRDLKDVSTSSIEAYRYYVEGIDLHNRARDIEAVPLLEKAVATDPNFAMALVKLAVVEGNLGHPLKREEYAKRAMEHLDRLSARERYYIEGYYYSDRGNTLTRAIDAYKKAIELYPDHASARHNLALLYSQLGRDDDALPLYEELRRRGTAFPITYSNLASLYGALGQYEKGYDVLQEYIRSNPRVAQGYIGLGDLLSAWGKPDEAIAAYDKASELTPGNLAPFATKETIYVVTDRWADADAVNQRLLQSSDPRWKFTGLMNQANVQLYHGRLGEALRLVDGAAASVGPRGSVQSANARRLLSNLLLERGEPAAALVAAERSLVDTNGIGPGAVGSLAAVARLHARLGHASEAAKADAELKRLIEQIPSDRVRQILPRVQAGRRALDRHDAGAAIQAFKQAAAFLRPGDANAPARFDLGRAYLETGNDAEAAPQFEKFVTSGVMRAAFPIEFVRSLYFLGQISERRGDRAKAAEYYRRFVQYWGDGELDRARIAEARRKIGS